MPKFTVTTVEQWSVRATYRDVEAETWLQAVDLVKSNQSPVTAHEPLLEEHTVFDELLYVDDENDERVYDFDAETTAKLSAAQLLYTPPPDVAEMGTEVAETCRPVRPKSVRACRRQVPADRLCFFGSCQSFIVPPDIAEHTAEVGKGLCPFGPMSIGLSRGQVPVNALCLFGSCQSLIVPPHFAEVHP